VALILSYFIFILSFTYTRFYRRCHMAASNFYSILASEGGYSDDDDGDTNANMPTSDIDTAEDNGGTDDLTR